MPLKWKSSYNLGIKEIDTQHRHFFTILNRLLGTIGPNPSETADLDSIKADLLAHVDEHFRTEEEIFVKYNYPEAENHKAEHDLIRNNLISLLSGFDKSSPKSKFELFDFLKDWLIDHLIKSDKKFSLHLKARPHL